MRAKETGKREGDGLVLGELLNSVFIVSHLFSFHAVFYTLIVEAMARLELIKKKSFFCQHVDFLPNGLRDSSLQKVN